MNLTQRFFGATLIFIAGAVLAPSASAQTIASSTLTLTIPARAALTVSPSVAQSFVVASTKAPNAGTTNFSYFVSASQAGGTGSIALKITSDSADAASPAVTYTCTAAVGTACSNTQAATALHADLYREGDTGRQFWRRVGFPPWGEHVEPSPGIWQTPRVTAPQLNLLPQRSSSARRNLA
jgi:hypothetical protein